MAYDPKVVTIWEGMRGLLHEEANRPVEFVLFSNYEAQVQALLASPERAGTHRHRVEHEPRVPPGVDGARGGAADRHARHRSRVGRARRAAGGAVGNTADLSGRTLALGSRDSGHAAILPVHFLAGEGLVEGRDYTERFDTDVGKHGDTGTSEVEVLKAVLAHG